jgi:hypothetical protein
VGAYILGGSKDRFHRKDRAKSTIAGRHCGNFDELSHAVSLAGGGINQKLPSVYKA